MLSKIRRHFKNQHVVGLILDLLVVIAGILLAFQIDRAYEAWQDRQDESSYLERLLKDLEGDKTMYEDVRERAVERLEQIRILQEVIDNPESISGREADFVYALERVTWRNFPVINGYTYSEMLTSGKMTLLRSENLRRKLSDYYSRLEDTERLGFGEDDQDHFRTETLGILSTQILMHIENETDYPLNISQEEGLDMAREFAARQTAHQWIGRLAKYQVLMSERADEFTRRAEVLEAEILTML